MNKKIYYAIGTILLAILATSIIVQLPSQNVQIKITEDEAIFYQNTSGKFEITGVEKIRLIKGTTTMWRQTDGIKIFNISEGDFLKIVRETPYYIKPYSKEIGPLVIETWTFNTESEDITQFPVEHRVEILNGKNLFLRYTVDELEDTGEKRKIINETELSFGKNMRIEFNENYNWAWIGYPYGADSFSAQYKIESDYEEFNFRLFDPPADSIEFVFPTPDNGSTQTANNIFVNVSANITGNEHYVINSFNRDLSLWLTMGNTNSTGAQLDSSGNGHNFTLLGNTQTVTNGKWGNGTYYDGIDDRMSAPLSGSLNITRDFTIAAWVRLNSTGHENQVHSQINTRGWRFGVFSTNVIYFLVINASGAQDDASGDTPLSANTWYHIAVTRNASAGGKTYLNGIFNGEDPTLPLGNLTYDVTAVTIGNRGDLARDMNGTIDEIIIFNRILNVNEIASLYNASANKYSNNFTNLSQGNYQFQAHAVNLSGIVTSTELRTVTISETSTSTTIPSSPTFNLTFIVPFNGTTIYGISFDSNLTTHISQPALSTTQSINYSINATTAPNALDLLSWLQDNFFARQIKAYFGNIPRLIEPYNRNYTIYFLTEGNISGQLITVRINVTEKMSGIGGFSSGASLNNQSLILTGGTIFGGTYEYNSTQTQIPFKVE